MIAQTNRYFLRNILNNFMDEIIIKSKHYFRCQPCWEIRKDLRLYPASQRVNHRWTVRYLQSKLRVWNLIKEKQLYVVEKCMCDKTCFVKRVVWNYNCTIFKITLAKKFMESEIYNHTNNYWNSKNQFQSHSRENCKTGIWRIIQDIK